MDRKSTSLRVVSASAASWISQDLILVILFNRRELNLLLLLLLLKPKVLAQTSLIKIQSKSNYICLK